MVQEQGGPAGPDLTQGIALSDLVDGRLVGHVGEAEVLLVRVDSEVFAIGAHCSHYHAPLVDGIVVEKAVRCPWHHACFDLRSGEAMRAPALSAVECWKVEQRAGRIFVKGTRGQVKSRHVQNSNGVTRIVLVGGGAAGFAAAEMLRRCGFGGSISMLSQDQAPPVDRPNLSKDYLAGNAPEEWLPLRPEAFYADNGIELRVDAEIVSLDLKGQEVVKADGERIGYDRLLLATGAEPIRPAIPGADQDRVHTLRSVADCRAIIKRVKGARRVLVIGASFIGLEVAAALVARGLEVHVVAPEARPMERILGWQLGDFVRNLHEEHGVVFHLQDEVNAIEGRRAMFKSGSSLEVDFIVVGIGVRPRVGLAEKAGLTIDRGIAVNAFLETNVRGVYAAGDIARWPDPHSGGNVRVEHWVVAERQGQTAAVNMLGLNERFDAVPFFWSQHYDVPINYVGHVEQWDGIEIDGDIQKRDCLLRYKRRGRVYAVASVFRDVANLQAELEMERAAASDS
jgi:NADPH-dependent 2,4-dienoyl-CoA reductase/sulfur reductase-like enzyme/nitrite reductase/ring-hydroxylating ferredoxin subunit